MTAPAARLLTLLSLLQTGRVWTGRELAARLEASDRTVRRDVERLREMGYVITGTLGPEGGYRLGAGNALPPLLFDDDQTIAVAIALQSAPVAGVDIADGALRALATVRQVMPARLRHRLDTLTVTALAASASTSQVSTEVLMTLAAAVRDHQVLRFDYPGRGADPGDLRPGPPRRAEPHHVVSAQGRWLLLGWDLDRSAWRLYSIDRVLPRTPHGPRFVPRDVPGGDVPEFVAARLKGQDVNEWPCRGTVILDLPADEVLPFAGEGIVRAVDVNRCSLESGSWSWGALAASYSRFEAPMEVVGPPELVDAFEVLALRCAETAGRAHRR